MIDKSLSKVIRFRMLYSVICVVWWTEESKRVPLADPSLMLRGARGEYLYCLLVVV